MSGRSDLLRAAAFAAFDARGTDAFTDAIKRVIDSWYLWPLIEYEQALQAARNWDERHRAHLDRAIGESLQLLRETSHLLVAHGAGESFADHADVEELAR